MIEAIDIVDEDIHNVMPDEMQKQVRQVKKWIDARVGKREKKILDKELDRKGLRKTIAKDAKIAAANRKNIH